jgi:hypothetical protein
MSHIKLKEILLERNSDKRNVMNANYFMYMVENYKKYFRIKDEEYDFDDKSGYVLFRTKTGLDVASEYKLYSKFIGKYKIFNEESYSEFLKGMGFIIEYDSFNQGDRGWYDRNTKVVAVKIKLTPEVRLKSEEDQYEFSTDVLDRLVKKAILDGKNTIVHEFSHYISDLESSGNVGKSYKTPKDIEYDSDLEELQARLISVFDEIEDNYDIDPDGDPKRFLEFVIDEYGSELYYNSGNKEYKKSLIKRIYQYFNELK